MIQYNGKKYKVVVVTPAGRKKYMEVLLQHILLQKTLIDEYRIWLNTTVEEDVAYLKSLENKYPDFIKIDYLPDGIVPHGNTTICHFFRNCVDNQTIYLRFDDDIVWMDPGFILNILQFRIDNPNYFLVLGNIVNNAVCDHKHQNNGIPYTLPIKNDCLCSNGWGNAELAHEKHQIFLANLMANNLQKYYFDRIESSARFSINCICWFGYDLEKFGGHVDKNTGEEPWLTEIAPRKLSRVNCVYGGSLCVHFAFWIQRDFLDKTDLLQKYNKILFM